MYKYSLLAAALLGSGTASPAVQYQSSHPGQADTSAEPLLPDYIPPNFIPTYNRTYCPASSTAVYIPPVYAYYPFAPSEVYNIVGSFVNETWISPAFNDTTYVGTDNVPGVIRTQNKDPFGAVEILFHYETAKTPYGFFHQQAAHSGKNITVAPGLLETDSHAVLQMMPACNGTGTSWGFYLTYCFDNATMAETPGFDLNVTAPKLTEAIIAGTGRGLKNLWTILDSRETSFNSTASCVAIQEYQNGGSGF